jgi:hypothetical protein
MARYPVYTSPARGHLFPIVPTLEKLRRRGHGVVVRTLSSEVVLLRELGFEAAPIDPAIERREIDDWRAMEKECPAMLLLDINTWGAMAAAETAGMLWATWCLTSCWSPRAPRRRLAWGFRPRGLLGRLRDRLLSPVLLGLYNRQAPELDAVRTELGAPPVGRIERAMLRAPLMLYMTAEPFEYPRSD